VARLKLRPPACTISSRQVRGLTLAELRILAGMQRLIPDDPGLVIVAEFRPSFLRAQGVSTAAWLEAFAQAGLKIAAEIDESAAAVEPLRPGDALDQVFSINIAFSASLEALAPTNRPRQ